MREHTHIHNYYHRLSLIITSKHYKPHPHQVLKVLHNTPVPRLLLSYMFNACCTPARLDIKPQTLDQFQLRTSVRPLIFR